MRVGVRNLDWLTKERLMEVVENASDDSSESGSTDVIVGVVDHDIARVAWVEPVLENSWADSQSRVEGGTSPAVNGAESPEDEADSGEDPYRGRSMGGLASSHMQNVGHEDESADHLHIEGGRILI